MQISDDELVTYLANVICVAHADHVISPKEQAALESIRTAVGAKKATLSAAIKAVEAGGYVPARVGSFATQVSNVEDMLYMCFVDGEVNPLEKTLLVEHFRKAGLTQEQLNRMTEEAISRANSGNLVVTCPSCSTEVHGAASFCPKCGRPLSSEATEPIPLSIQIPSSGFSIEFCESTAASFPAALAFAKSAPVFSSAIRAKKNWYLANWPEAEFKSLARLGQLLSGIRNRRAYQAGKEIPWEELFGFSWCAAERERAYKPLEYCFGKDENRLNPWGCKQANLEWSEWAGWFSYGEFRQFGVLNNRNMWIFDKERIRHELLTNLHRVRFCPHLRHGLADAVLKALPDQVEVTENGAWAYSHSHEQKPGSIKIVEIEKEGDFQFKSEYFADGVRPRGLAVLEETLRRALEQAGARDVSAAQLVH